MIKDAIEYILKFRDVGHLTIGGRDYTDKKIEPVLDPMPAMLNTWSLTGIVDFLEANVDELNKEKQLIHVASPLSVYLMSCITGDFEQRKNFLKAEYKGPVFRFGNFMDVETFIIALQSQFVQDDTTASLLKIVGNLKHEEGIQQMDDGVTQEVTTKIGVTKVKEIEAPNPVTLQPYRTFLEIDQPASQFVFRMQGGAGILCALFEADGGAWKLEAISRIRDWLKNQLPDIAIIA